MSYKIILNGNFVLMIQKLAMLCFRIIQNTKSNIMAQSLLQLNSEWKPKLEASLETQQLTQRSIVERLKISRSSVSKFINGKSIIANNFIRICQELNLDWGNASAGEQKRSDEIVSFKNITKKKSYLSRLEIAHG